MDQCDAVKIQMSIGDNIRIKREAKGLSQKAMAEAIGSGENTVAGWEKGKNAPPGDKVVSMAKLFECSTDEILLDASERSQEAEMMALFRRINELSKERKPIALGMLSSITQVLEIEEYFRGDDRGKPR